jgi:hypothetical protein
MPPIAKARHAAETAEVGSNDELSNKVASATTAIPLAWRWQQRHCDVRKDASAAMATMAIAPGRQEQRRQCHDINNGTGAGLMPAMTTLLRWQQRRHLDNSDGASAKTATMHIATTARTPAPRCWQGPSNDGNGASVTMTPAQWRQQFQSDGGKGAIAMSARMPAPQLWRWQRRQGNARDDASVTMSTMAQVRHHNNGNGTSAKTATMYIATTTKMPALQWQQCPSNDGNGASATMTPAQWRQWFQSDDGKGAIAMSARMPAPQLQWWQLHQDNAQAMMATLPAQRQCQSHNGNDAQATPVLRRQQCPSNASATTATMPKRRWQQCQRDDNASAATTERCHAPHQRNACQWDAGNDASGNCAEEGDFSKDNNFGTKWKHAKNVSASTTEGRLAGGTEMTPAATLPRKAISSRTATSAQKAIWLMTAA